jgi:NCS1 family nucleobase:cation symporter-1
VRAPSSDAEFVRQESIYGRLPLLPEEREYGTRGAHSTNFAYAVATWCFLTGGYVAQYVGAIQGMVALIAGSVVGCFLTTMPLALASQRYGLEQIDYCKSAFGQKGSRILLLFYLINQLGWTGLILVMFGNGVRNTIIGLGYEPPGWIVGAGVAVGIWLVYLLVTRGIHLMNITNEYVGPGLMIVTIVMIVLLLRNYGWSEIVAAEPLDPFEEPWLNYVIAVELAIAGGISWFGGVGFLARNTKTRRNAVYPEILHLGLSMGIVCCVGLFSSLVLRTDDPTEWLIPIAGPVMGLVALLFVAVANITSSAISVYASGLALRHLDVLKVRPWWHIVLWTLVPCVPVVIWPSETSSMGSNFLAYNGTLYAPVVGILFADFVFIRRQRLNVRAIFDNDPNAEYHYTRGFHWPALICMILGQAIFFALLDPLTFESHRLFQFLTASLPACIVPGIVYTTWLKLRPRKRVALPAIGEPLKEPNI